jgi:cytoskeletal protein CcmA (bactofilin family)
MADEPNFEGLIEFIKACSEAEVFDTSKVSGHTIVTGNAKVYGNSQISADNLVINGNCTLESVNISNEVIINNKTDLSC